MGLSAVPEPMKKRTTLPGCHPTTAAAPGEATAAPLGNDPAPALLAVAAAVTAARTASPAAPPRRATETARAATAAGFVETGEAPAAIPAPAVSRPRCPDRDTAAPRTESCRAGALVAPASEALAPPDPDESADAMGIDAIAAPTPNATANAPTRPM